MARLVTDGAEFQDLLAFSLYSGVSIETTIKRTGAAAYKINGGGQYFQYTIAASDEVFLRIPQYFITIRNDQTSLKFLLLSGTTVVGSIFYNGLTGRFEVWTGNRSTLIITSTHTFPTTATWYMLEVRYKLADAGAAEIKVDGVSEGTFSGDTKPGAETTIDSVKYQCADSNQTDAVFDDLGINNTDNSDGKGDTSWLGEGKIELLKPNGNGTTNQWTGQDADSTNNYLNVDEIPSDGDTTYNEDSTPGNQDMYAVEDFTGTGKVILRVLVEARARDTVPEGAQMKLGVRTNATNYLSAAISLAGSFGKIIGENYKINPNDSAAWEDADLDAIELILETV